MTNYSELQCSDCGDKCFNGGLSRRGSVWKCEDCWEKSNTMTNEPRYHPCHLCEKNGTKRDAVGFFSPDLDIKGLCFCAEHKEDTMIMYMRIVQDARESYKPKQTEP